MTIAVAGDVHGSINNFYEKLTAHQETMGRRIDAVLQVGDLQVYSDESQLDKAVARHGGVGDFPEWFREQRRVPILTFAILGNHDDAQLFYRHAGKEIVPSLHLLPQGEVTTINVGGQLLRVGALGGNYSPKYFQINPDKLPSGKLKHYTEMHINSLIDQMPFDILLTHEAPTGFITRNGVDLGRPEISNLIEQVKPRFAFFGHHHRHVEGKIGDTIVVGLANALNDGGLYVMENVALKWH